jgi:phthalate 4,5-dioxygenase
MLSRADNKLITRTGPGTPMGELWRRFWLPALMSWELPQHDCPPVRIRLLSENLVAFRDTDGTVALVAEHCPHRGASLFFGRNEERGLRCVYHGWKFDATGACVDMPNEPPESNFKHKVRVTAYPCVERAGIIWAYMGPPKKRPEVPQLAWMLLPESHRYTLKFEVECNYLQALEGDIDDSHFAFLHSRLDPDTSKPFLERVRNGTIMTAGQGIKPFYVQDTRPKAMLKETDVGITMAWRRETADDVYSWHINHWFMPYGMVMGGAPSTSQLGALRVPIDDEHSWQFRIRWNPYRELSADELHDYKQAGVFYPELIPGTFRCVENKDNDYLIDREAQERFSASGIKSQVQQDRAVNEPIGAIYDRTKEHLGTSDAAVIAVRRRLLRAARELAQGVEPYGATHGTLWRLIPVDLELPRNMPFEDGARERISGARTILNARSESL